MVEIARQINTHTDTHTKIFVDEPIKMYNGRLHYFGRRRVCFVDIREILQKQFRVLDLELTLVVERVIK